MDVLILCGGLGTRLRGAVGETQKVMALVDDRPFLDILLEHIQCQGFRRVILCVGYRAETVECYYRQRKSPLTLVFSKEHEPLGTGGALKLAEPLVKASRFFVLNGDSFCPVDFGKLLRFHQTKKALVSMVVSRVKETSDYGTVVVDANSQEVKAFVEKEKLSVGAGRDLPLQRVNAGVYCFEKNIFKLMPQQKKFSLEHDVFPHLVGREFYGFVVDEEFTDIGTPERYQQAKSDRRVKEG